MKTQNKKKEIKLDRKWIKECIKSVKAEILSDKRLRMCEKFADLHEHCDANMIGKMSEASDKFPGMENWCAQLNEVMFRVNKWMRTRSDKWDIRLAKKALFTIDDMGKFQGWTFGETWNGWQCPFFEFDEAVKIPGVTYDKKRNLFIWVQEDVPVEERENCVERDEIASTVINTPEGKKEVWPIGNHGWVWDLAEKEKSDHDLKTPWKAVPSSPDAKGLWRVVDSNDETVISLQAFLDEKDAKAIALRVSVHDELIAVIKSAAAIQHEYHDTYGEIACTKETPCIFCQALATAGVQS